MFDTKENQIEKSITNQDWRTREIVPQSEYCDESILKIPEINDYVTDLILNAAGTSRVSRPEVTSAIYRLIYGQLQNWAIGIGLGGEVINVYEQVIARDDANLQTLVYALSYFGDTGIALGNALSEYLDEAIPETMIPLIGNGYFDETGGL